MNNEIKPRTVYLLRRTDKEDNGKDLYVGSTSQTLKKRLGEHKSYTKICNSKLYKRMVEVGLRNWEIIPLLSRTCNRSGICKVERKWIEILNPNLNTVLPSDTDNKWKNTGKEKMKRERYYFHKQNKTYYCNVCNKAFGYGADLKKHFESLKHSYAYLNSLD